MKKTALFIVTLLLLAFALGVGGSWYISRSVPGLDDAQVALIAAAEKAGATSLTGTPMDDGGLRLNGMLEGRSFSLLVPWRWNKQVVLWANGYSAPGARNNLTAPPNPLDHDTVGVLRTPYARGFAIGESAYDKSGMAVESAIENTHRLKQFADRLGSTRAYIFGASMGGNITMGLIEKYPHDFSGAIAACGVVGDWPHEVGWLIDIRAAYNYFTRGTAYELPGDKSLAHSALATFPTGPLSSIAPVSIIVQITRVRGPVLALFAAAKANPGGVEDRIIDNIVTIADTVKDPAAFAAPLATVALGQDDLNATFGGMIYDNTHKTYSSPHLSDAENAALNHDIQRVQADPAAVAKANEWYKPTGKFEAKLISLYNAVDPLVPTDVNEPQLRDAIAQAGNADNFVDRPVPPKEDPHVLGSDMAGLAHCGFTAEQIIPTVNDVIDWVETGKKPQ
jgi:pimeloyl-ACP methyl ester carboxylesterase